VASVALVAATSVGTPTSGAATRHTGTLRVLSAGSLTNVMVLLAAAFTHATGYRVQNTPMGSSAIASGIVSTTLQGDVFISAAASADRSLEGAAHGNWINGYRALGTSPDVLAYYPKSRFAAALRTRPWYDVIQSRGFQLGRTNPAVDPGGVLDVDALDGIGYAYNIPSLLSLATTTANVYTEESLTGLLQAGQLDGAFMYAVAARAARLPYVALIGTRNLAAHFTIAALNRAPDPAAAAAFVTWLLSPAGASIMASQGLTPARAARGA
jgi:molybdate/tungstate transport system substrate-binding protein